MTRPEPYFSGLTEAIDYYRRERRIAIAAKLTAVKSACGEGKHDEARRLLAEITDECAREGLTTTGRRIRDLLNDRRTA